MLAGVVERDGGGGNGQCCCQDGCCGGESLECCHGWDLISVFCSLLL